MGMLWITVIIALATFSCEGRRVPRQSVSVPANSIAKRIVCYYQNWSIWRPDDQYFSPDDINPNICTHIIYAYAKIEKGQEALVSFDPEGDLKRGGFEKFVALRKKNRDLKMMLSAGGGREGTALFSQIAGDPDSRTRFILGAIRFVRFYDFDGFDLSWQWPGLWTGGTAADRGNYVLFAKEMREAIVRDSQETGRPELIFSIVSPKFEQEIVRGFNMEELAMYVDFFNVKSYGYHTSADPSVHHLAPLYSLPGDDINQDFTIDNTINYYSRLGVDMEKLNLAIPLYGISFYLTDAQKHDIGDPADEAGEGTEIGALWYNQICQRAPSENWTVVHVNRTAMGPYAYKDRLWVAYEDEESVKNKARFAGERGIGGLMFWSIDFDDFRGVCHGRTFPLIKAALETFVMTDAIPTSRPPRIDTTTSTRRPVQTNGLPLQAISVSPQRGTVPPLRPRPPVQRPQQPLSQQQPAPPRQPLGTQRSPRPVNPVMNIPDFDDNADDNTVFSVPSGIRTIVSRGDVFFQNIRMWINNYFVHPSNIKGS